MKQGNQYYLELQVINDNNELLDVSIITKVVFTIGNLTKIYSENSDEVSYDEDKKCFKIWLTEEETFNFDQKIRLEARISFINNNVVGTYIEQQFVYDSLNKDILTEE